MVVGFEGFRFEGVLVEGLGCRVAVPSALVTAFS